MSGIGYLLVEYDARIFAIRGARGPGANQRTRLMSPIRRRCAFQAIMTVRPRSILDVDDSPGLQRKQLELSRELRKSGQRCQFFMLTAR